MDQRKMLIADALTSELGAENIVERNDASIRQAEGLEAAVGRLSGTAPAETWIEVGGIEFAIDFLRSHKTGFYLDQINNYAAVAAQARGRRVLDCFSNQGGFAIACARAGATDVVGVEESADALDLARRNVERNRVQIRWVAEDAFRFLRGAEKAEASYDLIILDPPSFTKGRSGLHDALRGYKELHVRAFKLLSRDGMLATFSCSHHVSQAVFDQMISDALVDARRSARRLRHFEQSLDHPVLPTVPETEYFKGTLLEMMAAR
jgi:23S rRNA (cytosine1962-C5)-methyltransferase